MSSVAASQEIVESYIQADGLARAGLFKAFLKSLESVSRADGMEAARRWAMRAVSPDLDYTSLLALRKFLRTSSDDPSRLRLAVLGGPTTIQLVELIKLFLAGEGMSVEVYEAEYGLFRQEILTPGSGLDLFKPQIVFLATGARDPARIPAVTMDEETVRQLVERELGDWLKLWEVAHDKWGAGVIQNTFEITPWSAMGHFSLRHAASRENYLDRLNLAFAAQAPPHVVLHDLRALVAQTGAREWFDSRFYLEAKMPCGPECLVSYTHSVSSLIKAMSGRSKRVLVLDLDNTLWGGVVGDVGVEGIQLGQGSGEGEAYLQFQHFAKTLHDRGILLAACSKNDENIARQPFEQRDDMALKLADISCFIANWENKAENLREIARRLAVGADSLVFVDDNPVERAIVRRFLPEVAVPDMPEDPAAYVQALSRHRFFETVSWTSEDANRAQYYAQNAARSEISAQFHDLDSFLASLQMRAKLEPVHQHNIERVTQLVNKSNQFNVTTRRRTLAEIDAVSGHADWITLCINLRDQMGDNGLISVILMCRNADAFAIDTWLMSCRVLQRGVEELALNELVNLCKTRGCSKLKGVYIPTGRNGMVKDLFPRLGFEPAGTDGAATRWVLEVGDSYQPRPTHIKTETP